MSYVLAILAAAAGAFVSFLMVVLLFASAPNSTPAQWAEIRAWLIAVALVALGGLVGAVWLSVVKRPLLGAGVGALPALFCIVSFIIILRSQRGA
jgi:cytochrome c biogenesis protein CcdA